MRECKSIVKGAYCFWKFSVGRTDTNCW